MKNLPKGVPASLDLETSRVMAQALDTVKNSYKSLAGFIDVSEKPALHFPDGSGNITYRTLRQFVDEFDLGLGGGVTVSSAPKPVVCIALPNGPVLAATAIAVANRYTAAPVNLAVGPEQFQADVLQFGASAIITTKQDAAKMCLDGDSWIKQYGIDLFYIEFDERHMRPFVCSSDGRVLVSKPQTSTEPSIADDIAIILFTSGTSGTKKIVPITVHSIVCGVAFVINSWALTREDVCLNMMPLYHM
jgi:long-subunit acyl-CoA synthetase (AMP-forming)